MKMKTDPAKSNNFNLLRFIFASLVIVSHAHELRDGNRSNEILTRIFGSISFGDLAVDCFFILSGYLISKSWIERPSVWAFFSSRVLRIYPGFIVASLFCAFLVGPIYGAFDYFQSFNPMSYLGSVGKLKSPAIPPVFQGSHYPVVNGAMWSISYEFVCYMLVLVCGIVGVFKRSYLFLALAIFCTIAHVATRLGLIPDSFDKIFRCVMAFSFGGCFYIYRQKIVWNRYFAIVAVIITSVLLFSKPLAEPALCIFFGYAILYFAYHASLFHGFNRVPDISYGIYLYAWPINKIILSYSPAMNAYLSMVLVFVLSACCGVLSWYLIEKPSLKVKAIFRRRTPVLTSQVL